MAGHKVVVCHRTSSLVHPFVVITVDIASSGGLGKVMGHYDHVWDLNKKGWGDIISGFTYAGVEYPPQWDPDSTLPVNTPEICSGLIFPPEPPDLTT